VIVVPLRALLAAEETTDLLRVSRPYQGRHSPAHRVFRRRKLPARSRQGARGCNEESWAARRWAAHRTTTATPPRREWRCWTRWRASNTATPMVAAVSSWARRLPAFGRL